MYQHLLVATDGSQHALRATRAAGEIARKFGADIILLSVFHSPLGRSPAGVPEAALLDSEAVERYADAVFDEIGRDCCPFLDEIGVRYELRREVGHPVDMIVSVAARSRVDLIVMGSRGLGGPESFLLGSVANGVLHHANCPVLIVK